jgi:hypothetical protein
MVLSAIGFLEILAIEKHSWTLYSYSINVIENGLWARLKEYWLKIISWKLNQLQYRTPQQLPEYSVEPLSRFLVL